MCYLYDLLHARSLVTIKSVCSGDLVLYAFYFSDLFRLAIAELDIDFAKGFRCINFDFKDINWDIPSVSSKAVNDLLNESWLLRK